MSVSLLVKSFKRNWLLLTVIFGVLTMYMMIMINMFDPENVQELTDVLMVIPVELQNAMGISGSIATLTSYLASWLYGLLMLGFPMVYCIILGNRLVAKMVDNGSFTYLLSTPNSRTKLIVTQGIYGLLSIFVMSAALFSIAVLSCGAMFPGLLDIPAFLSLNITTMLVNMVVMMICFFFSCLFNESKTASALGAGVSVFFMLMNMLGGVSEEIKILKAFSIYGLYNPIELINGASVWGTNLIYIGIILVLFAACVVIFKKKRLPI